MEKCVNCGIEVEGKYCPNCGQRQTVKRITFREGWFDFWSRIYGFDGMFPRTLRDLTIRPGVVATRYIERNRILYYGPVGYCFLIITVFLLIASMITVDIREFLSHNQGRFMGTPEVKSQDEQLNKQIMDFVAENLKIIAFMVIPFNAFVARFLFFRKSGFNYLEHLVMPFYLIGHMYWLSVVSIIVYKLTGTFVVNDITSVVLLLYFGFAYSNFITYQPKWKSFLKGIGVYVVGQLTLVTIAIIIAIAVVLILAYVNPDALEAIRPYKD